MIILRFLLDLSEFIKRYYYPLIGISLDLIMAQAEGIEPTYSNYSINDGLEDR